MPISNGASTCTDVLLETIDRVGFYNVLVTLIPSLVFSLPREDVRRDNTTIVLSSPLLLDADVALSVTPVSGDATVWTGILFT